MVVLRKLVTRTSPRRRSSIVGRFSFVLMIVLSTFGVTPAFAASGANVLPDYPIPNGHFYSQASGTGIGNGFAIVDDGNVQLYDEFTRVGGVDAVGYPSSQRFVLGGFATQATQKELLQWRPETKRATFVNIFDVMSQRGLDPELAKSRLIPPTADNGIDSRLTWPQVVARHLAVLDQNPAIKARYFAAADPLTDFGLPQGAGDFGGVFVIRCERAAFQQWRVGTSFASPGDVTLVNAGDLAKEFGLVPTEATVPAASGAELIAPPGDLIHTDSATISAAWRAAAVARPSLVRIDVTLPDATGIASGVVLDQDGHILTNQHVVDGAQTVTVTFVNGVVLPARVVGVDVNDDLAVVQVPATSIGSGVKPATIVGGSRLVVGQYIVGFGFSPFFPSPPAVRLGVFQLTLDEGIGILRSDTYILPGDSGGMLLDLAGNVVGINDEIRITGQAQQPLIGFSIDAADAARIARQIIQGNGPNGGG